MLLFTSLIMIIIYRDNCKNEQKLLILGEIGQHEATDSTYCPGSKRL
jgi:hypothetical protein